ncbi:MAG: permease [Candidatus Zixiibacteriota bacterium]
MLDIVIHVAEEFWSVLADMAPYLLFGFLVAGVLSVAVSPRFVEKHLGGRGFWPVFKASALGVPLPLCSCGVIPVAASLRKHGASRGATTSFLLSTPQTGVDSIMVTFSLLGPIFALFRPLVALVTGLIGGQLVDSFDKTRDLNMLPMMSDSMSNNMNAPQGNALKRIFSYGFVALPQDISKSLLIGLVAAGLIAAVIPDDFFLGLLGAGFASMIVMMLLGIPLYVCATASVPIAAALILKGISPGAALVFLVTGPATNAATITTIWKVLGKKTTFIYLATVAVTALASGFLLDQIMTVSDVHHDHGSHGMLPGWSGTASALLLLAILGYAAISPYLKQIRKSSFDISGAGAVLRVHGMTCNHCVANVKRALSECSGVEDVRVDLTSGIAAIYGKDFDLSALKKSVEDVGYTVSDKS